MRRFSAHARSHCLGSFSFLKITSASAPTRNSHRQALRIVLVCWI
jgi:hypothetical protein